MRYLAYRLRLKARGLPSWLSLPLISLIARESGESLDADVEVVAGRVGSVWLARGE